MPRQIPFSDQIRKLIDDADETRYRIAVETGIDHAVMSRFMTGKGGLSMDSIDALSKYFGWTINADEKKRHKKGK